MAKANRSGKRKERGQSKQRKPDLGYYYIVTDTKATERNYLLGLQNALPAKVKERIVIKVNKAKTADLARVCKSKAALEPQYAEPWIVLDRDQVPGFDKIISEAEKYGIGVGWSNPCIEIWFDAYFGQMHGYQESKQCWNRFAETFERRTGMEYDKANDKIYDILNRYGDEQKAIQIAEQRLRTHMESGIDNPSEMVPATTLHCLVKEIKDKTNT